jgi:hypothetical protein
MKKNFEGYDNGEWYAVTLGEFISLLVDAGHDPAVKFRVKADGPLDENRAFERQIEMVLLPDGHVLAAAKECYAIHKTLLALIKGGVVK